MLFNCQAEEGTVLQLYLLLHVLEARALDLAFDLCSYYALELANKHRGAFGHGPQAYASANGTLRGDSSSKTATSEAIAVLSSLSNITRGRERRPSLRPSPQPFPCGHRIPRGHCMPHSTALYCGHATAARHTRTTHAAQGHQY